MSYSYVESVNFFGKTSPEALASKYGTPLYVYNENVLRACMRKVSEVIKVFPYHANYSVKANTNVEILKIAFEEGLNADAMSPGEILQLQKAGFTSDRIFFIPNNVSVDELEFAKERNIITSLDSLEQLELFAKKIGGNCAVRINPGVGAGHHEKVITAGKKTKFGIAEEDIDKIFEIADKYDIKIVGINQHVGSLFMDPEPFLKAVENFLRIAERFDDLEFIDFGGGYGVPYHKLENEQPFDFDSFSERLEKLLVKFSNEYKRKLPLFKTEPGRYCVAESGVILGRINATKQNAGHKYAGSDIGMNVLVRPSMYDSWHDIEVFRENQRVDADGECEKITVTGNICESGDLLAKDRELPVIKSGDLICVLDAGAYGYSMCSNYNSRLKPAEVLITNDGNDRCIRARETYEDLFNKYM